MGGVTFDGLESKANTFFDATSFARLAALSSESRPDRSQQCHADSKLRLQGRHKLESGYGLTFGVFEVSDGKPKPYAFNVNPLTGWHDSLNAELHQDISRFLHISDRNSVAMPRTPMIFWIKLFGCRDLALPTSTVFPCSRGGQSMPDWIFARQAVTRAAARGGRRRAQCFNGEVCATVNGHLSLARQEDSVGMAAARDRRPRSLKGKVFVDAFVGVVCPDSSVPRRRARATAGRVSGQGGVSFSLHPVCRLACRWLGRPEQTDHDLHRRQRPV